MSFILWIWFVFPQRPETIHEDANTQDHTEHEVQEISETKANKNKMYLWFIELPYQIKVGFGLKFWEFTACNTQKIILHKMRFNLLDWTKHWKTWENWISKCLSLFFEFSDVQFNMM